MPRSKKAKEAKKLQSKLLRASRTPAEQAALLANRQAAKLISKKPKFQKARAEMHQARVDAACPKQDNSFDSLPPSKRQAAARAAGVDIYGRDPQAVARANEASRGAEQRIRDKLAAERREIAIKVKQRLQAQEREEQERAQREKDVYGQERQMNTEQLQRHGRRQFDTGSARGEIAYMAEYSGSYKYIPPSREEMGSDREDSEFAGSEEEYDYDSSTPGPCPWD